jgi:2-polyprenyl-3-methyl-5-hydroxy-6-metoxy-1,4-benzoquinol methylase
MRAGPRGPEEEDPMQRRRVPERMDDPALPEAEHRHALAGLARLNRVAAADRLAWHSVRRAAERAARAGRPARVIDVACGAGDAIVRLSRRAAGAGLGIEWTACDASEVALRETARAAQAAGARVRTARADAVRGELPSGHDLVTCSLFVHHLDSADAVAALARMRAAAAAGAVIDLDRTRTGLALAWAASRAFSRSAVVHFDATASVRAAWTPAEALGMARAAGIAGACVRRAWPERWVLTWGDA